MRTADAMLDSLAAQTRRLVGEHHAGRHRPDVRPIDFLPVVFGHVAHLQRRLELEPHRRRLQVITGEASVLAGWLAFRQANRGDAQHHCALAERLAREAGDGPLLAFALAARSILHSSFHLGGQGGHTQMAIELLSEAVRSAGRGSDPRLRAWLHAHRAREYAALPAAQGTEADKLCQRDLAEAERAMAEAAGPPRDGFPHECLGDVVGYRADCAVLLGHSEHAGGLLEAKLRQIDPQDLSSRGSLSISLATACARQREVDRACALLSEALDLATRIGTPWRVQRIEGVRLKHLSRWYREPVVRALDDQLRDTSRGSGG